MCDRIISQSGQLYPENIVWWTDKPHAKKYVLGVNLMLNVNLNTRRGGYNLSEIKAGENFALSNLTIPFLCTVQSDCAFFGAVKTTLWQTSIKGGN